MEGFFDAFTRIRRKREAGRRRVCQLMCGVRVRCVLHEHDLAVIPSANDAQKNMQPETEPTVPGQIPVTMFGQSLRDVFAHYHFNLLRLAGSNSLRGTS